MDKELDDLLKHHGVKGMRWGVRRSGKKSVSTKEKKPSRIKEELSSLKRERQWKKVSKNIHNMSTKDINQAAQRIRMENDLRRLSKSVGTKKDRQDYRTREKMSNEELNRKVTRLRAKDNLNRAVNEASRSQRDLGRKIVNVAGPLAVKYAFNQSISPKDIFDTVQNSNRPFNPTNDPNVKSFLDKKVKNLKSERK